MFLNYPNLRPVGSFILKATWKHSLTLQSTRMYYARSCLTACLPNLSHLSWDFGGCWPWGICGVFYKINWRWSKQAEGCFGCAHHAAMSRHCACRHPPRLLGSQRIMTFKIQGSEVPTNQETHLEIPGHAQLSCPKRPGKTCRSGDTSNFRTTPRKG